MSFSVEPFPVLCDGRRVDLGPDTDAGLNTRLQTLSAAGK
jgi:hypothetical protein